MVQRLPKESKRLIEACLANAEENTMHSLSCLEGGGLVGRFEAAFAELMSARFALALSSGSAGLHAAVLACDIGPGDEVIVSPYGWGQTVAAVLATGATPVFADIVPETGNLDPNCVEQQVSERTRAVLVTHVHGLPADLEALKTICMRHGIWLIADAAQALGARYRGKPVGAWGDVVCFSFGRGKLVTTGEGGMVLTNNPDLYERMVLISQHPLRALRDIEDEALKNSITELGFSSRMSAMAAAIGLGQLHRISTTVERNRKFAARLNQYLEECLDLQLPNDTATARHSYYTYVVRDLTNRRLDRIHELRSLGLHFQAGPIPLPIHIRPPFYASPVNAWSPKLFRMGARRSTSSAGSFPNAELRCAQQDLYICLDSVAWYESAIFCDNG